MKNTWSNLFGTILAGSTITTVLLTANHLAKKYGQKPNPDKLFEVSAGKVLDYGINKFLKTGDDELINKAEQITEIIPEDKQ